MIAVRVAPKHPAKYSPSVLEVMDTMTREQAERVGKRQRRFRTLDPMAGTGRVHTLPGVTVGVELEPEWANMHPDTLVGDCLHLPFRRDHFDAIAVSPCYGNRLADSHDAKDPSTRHSYTHDLGRKLTEGNSGVMPYREDQKWTAPYRVFHQLAWVEAARVLRPDGMFILNCSNFFANKTEQFVTQWHVHTLRQLAFKVCQIEEVETPRMRYGANRERCPVEYVIRLRAPL